MSSALHLAVTEPLAVAARRLLVIHNPVAGRRRRGFMGRVVDALRQGGADVAVVETTGPRDAERLAGLAAAGALTDGRIPDAVVASGGDGTINEVVNGLLAAPTSAPPALGLIPLGTANVLAAELDLPSGAADLARTLAGAAPRTIHAGRANGRLFTMMAGVGLDAHVVEGVDPAVKRRLGKGAYVLESLAQIARWPNPRYRVTVEDAAGRVRVHEVASCIVAKGHFYGGRFVCAPDARLDEGGFQVCLFEDGGRLAALGYGAALVTGRLGRRGGTKGGLGYRVVPAARVRIEGPVGDPVQGDGDTIARLPVDMETAAPFHVLAPPLRPVSRLP
ncbi:diacylglycerol/lipid kinase family protein [Nitrospirillum sp. BR 11163]|uniref:diacylglycerol/lipid kinase family protein n=1 Tax=Nitrospirillum sp. BR 11163 TaxID=3104323 RepID=UPI002AFE6870|nr:diacylglycerol kinase family protein [Nitrospirillum sp. BR 11163]MEA1677113.1 diacylglycerol kinase family protein [Nitrospirillum sp. BR 11163]